ncbi:MAG: sigma-70 family RNA polymerase sigma factor [Bacteroidota bacterium]
MGRKKVDKDGSHAERTLLFKKYVEPNLGLIYDTVRTYTSNPSDYGDYCQEVLISLFRYIDTFKTEKNIQTWLITITIRYVGKLEAKRWIGFDINDDMEEGKKSFIQRYAPKSKIEYRYFKDRELFIDYTHHFSDMGASDELEKVLPKINPKYVRAFLMRHNWGWSLKEIAKCEGIQVDTAKMRVYMGKKALQKELAND